MFVGGRGDGLVSILDKEGCEEGMLVLAGTLIGEGTVDVLMAVGRDLVGGILTGCRVGWITEGLASLLEGALKE